MEENGFITQQEIEQKRVLQENVESLVVRVKELKDILMVLKKEVRNVRQDLRNMDKLRPLRNEEDLEVVE